MTLLRINRYLASCGIGSRRKVEEYILRGRVKVNHKVRTDLGFKVNPDKDIVHFDNKVVSLSSTQYFALYKPRGVIVTRHDEKERKDLSSVLPNLDASVFPIGRLDKRSEGLLLLTNDGTLANKLLHPSSEVEKVYRIVIKGDIQTEQLKKYVDGVVLDDGPAHCLKIDLLEYEKNRARIQVVVNEGRNRLLRRMSEALGYEVARLTRIGFAGIYLGKMKVGEFRTLSDKEIGTLKKSVTIKDNKRRG